MYKSWLQRKEFNDVAVVIISHVEILLIFLKWFKWYTFFFALSEWEKNLFVIL